MDDVLSFLPEPHTDAEYEAVIEMLLGEMRRHNAKMDIDRAKIERLKAESDVIGAHTDAVLADIKKQLDALEKAH